jgi:hypothetical protein
MEPSEFIPGVYRHYKGGLYLALMLVRHHETELQYVVYVPYDHPESGVRLREYDHGDSPWAGFVDDKSRFERVSP